MKKLIINYCKFTDDGFLMISSFSNNIEELEIGNIYSPISVSSNAVKTLAETISSRSFSVISNILKISKMFAMGGCKCRKRLPQTR